MGRPHLKQGTEHDLTAAMIASASERGWKAKHGTHLEVVAEQVQARLGVEQVRTVRLSGPCCCVFLIKSRCAL